MRLFFFATALSVCAVSGLFAQKPTQLKPVSFVSLNVPEPSDICYSAVTKSYFIASDSGYLSETDRDGKVLQQTPLMVSDFEAVATDGEFVYAIDETRRDVYFFNPKTLAIERVVNVPFSGGRNKGYEAMVYNKVKNCWILITEREPVILFEADKEFRITNKVDLSKIATDISAATWYNDAIWLMSDMDMILFKINPKTYAVEGKWYLPVLNPEGITFDENGNLLVTCDDMQRLYYFENPEKK
ncbi:SdiA-regulated domain-containing protein [Flavobacterium silvaticum]|uniref:WG repeat-containing protein n=1 Tax=Flavobacterium silvaticum TaxID=1852020 RepID=A0A972FP17_9FLAO|nr:SdiA-regulated domain-containing protein [Flavobacterium silvaticum]NMH29207.1 hypothetical protein [Flavobacterium silvaticum]